MKRVIVIALVLVSILAFTSFASSAEVPRYLPVYLFSSDVGIVNRVLIVDSVNGNLWVYERIEERDTERAYLSYQGKVEMAPKQKGKVVELYRVQKTKK